MREIKFRAWDEGLKQMIYFTMKEANDTVDCIIYEDIMQYTGLKDKDGKEIYEDDIIENIASFSYEKIKIKERVFWIDDLTGFDPFSTHDIDMGIVKVVGNVWENPGLLKSGK